MFALAPLRLRMFRPDDAVRCAQILQEGWADALPNRARPIGIADFQKLTEGETIIVATAGLSGPIGFVAIEPKFSFVHHLYVDATRRNRGAGAALLRAAVAMCGERVSLKCALANLSALEFYARQGWTWGERGFDADGAGVRLWSP
jgi:GNAT superfamily N-acetyltransferase